MSRGRCRISFFRFGGAVRERDVKCENIWDLGGGGLDGGFLDA